MTIPRHRFGDLGPNPRPSDERPRYLPGKQGHPFHRSEIPDGNRTCAHGFLRATADALPTELIRRGIYPLTAPQYRDAGPPNPAQRQRCTAMMKTPQNRDSARRCAADRSTPTGGPRAAIPPPGMTAPRARPVRDGVRMRGAPFSRWHTMIEKVHTLTQEVLTYLLTARGT